MIRRKWIRFVSALSVGMLLLAGCASPPTANPPRERPTSIVLSPSTLPSSPAGPVYRIVWSPDGKMIAAVMNKGIRLYDRTTLASTQTIDEGDYTESVAFSPDSARLACICGEGFIKIWDVKSGQLLKTLTDEKFFTSVAFNPNGTQIAGGNYAGGVKVWDARGDKLLFALEGLSVDVGALAFSADGKQILAGSSRTGTVKVWDANTGQLLHAFPAYSEFFGIEFSPDGTRMATSNIGGDVIKVWDVNDGQLLTAITQIEIIRFALSPDGKQVICACKAGIRVWDVDSGKQVSALSSNDPSVYSIAISPDGKQLAVGTVDGSIKMLNIVDTPNTLPTAMTTPTRPSILDVFPLGLGATWVYSVTLDYDENRQLIHWTGTITETITNTRRQEDAQVFESELQGRPPLSSFWMQSHQYVALANRLYQLLASDNPDLLIARQGQGAELAQMVTWPLAIGQQWGDPRDIARGDGYLVWRVEDKENIPSLAEVYANCFRLFLLTNPDDTTVWFCPGVGMTRREYHHHGSRIDEVWVLQRHIPGSPVP